MSETAVSVGRGGPGLIAAGGALALAGVVLAVSGEALAVLWGVAAVLAVAVGVAVAQPAPMVRLAVVLLLLVFQFRGEPGVSLIEAVSALALVAYLAHWYVAAWGRRARAVTSAFDVAAVTWGGAAIVGGMVLGQVFGADPYDFRADVIAAVPFLLYLPVKEACARERWGPLVVAGVLVVYGVASCVLSVVLFRSIIAGASELYEIADGRIGSGESAITVGLLVTLAAAAVTPGRRLRIVLLGLAGVLLGGLILTKSRGYWVASAVGVLAIGACGKGAVRRRLATSLVLGTAAALAVSFALFADEVVLVASGAANRLLSLASAGQDVSLLNRFAESAGAWDLIRANPILGYGWGVQSTHYSLISRGTVRWAFLHNGYLALWMKTGLWGLALMGFVWAGGLVRAARAARSRLATPVERTAALGAAGTLTALAITAYTSNPFSILDQMLVVTLTLALAHGVSDRVTWRARAAARPAPPAGDLPDPAPAALR